MKAPMSVAVRLIVADMVVSSDLKGDSARLLMYREFREKLSLSPEEYKLVGMVSEKAEGGIIRNYVTKPENDPMKVVEIGEIITEVLCKMLKPLEEEGNLNSAMLDTFLWFKPEIIKMRYGKWKREKNL